MLKTLLEACKRGDARSVRILLEDGADPNMVDQVMPYCSVLEKLLYCRPLQCS